MHHNVAVDFSDETNEATVEVVIKDGAIVELIGYLCKKSCFWVQVWWGGLEFKDPHFEVTKYTTHQQKAKA